MLNIVLVEPEIPSNTGNIARTCALTGSKLHLVKPLGFSVDDKHLKRAGLDYWHLLDITYYENIEDFLAKHSNDRLFLATTKAENLYSECTYQNGDYFLFGKETAGTAPVAARKISRHLHYDPHAGQPRRPLAQFIQFRSNYHLRGFAPIRLCRLKKFSSLKNPSASLDFLFI